MSSVVREVPGRIRGESADLDGLMKRRWTWKCAARLPLRAWAPRVFEEYIHRNDIDPLPALSFGPRASFAAPHIIEKYIHWSHDNMISKLRRIMI